MLFHPCCLYLQNTFRTDCIVSSTELTTPVPARCSHLLCPHQCHISDWHPYFCFCSHLPCKQPFSTNCQSDAFKMLVTGCYAAPWFSNCGKARVVIKYDTATLLTLPLLSLLLTCLSHVPDKLAPQDFSTHSFLCLEGGFPGIGPDQVLLKCLLPANVCVC